MTKEEAKKLLKYHSFNNEDVNQPKMKNGFLGMLRPFKGVLIEENYHELIKAIKVLSDEIRDGEQIDKEVISAIWGICHLARNWAVKKEGMLQRNQLLTSEQIAKLEKWLETISYAMMMMLDGHDNSTAFELYESI